MGPSWQRYFPIFVSQKLQQNLLFINIQDMVKLALGLLALVSFGSAKWEQHDYTPETSKVVADSIKAKLLASINLFANQDQAGKLKADLNTSDDSKRTLKELSALTANQLFTVLGLDDPNCDANGDGVIKGDELKCLNYAWKAYIPR